MGIIEAAKLVFEYAKYSEEGSVESVVRGADGIVFLILMPLA